MILFLSMKQSFKTVCSLLHMKMELLWLQILISENDRPLLICIYLPMCMTMCECTHVWIPMETKNGHQIPWSESYGVAVSCLMWALAAEPWSSAGAVSVLIFCPKLWLVKLGLLNQKLLSSFQVNALSLASTSNYISQAPLLLAAKVIY